MVVVEMIIAIGAAAQGANATPVIRARPRARLASLVAAEDYPASALEANEQGEVGFTLGVGADGRVSHCAITASSGSSALDAATCRIMRSRARFNLARDATGAPTADRIASSITWRPGAIQVSAITHVPAGESGPVIAQASDGPVAEPARALALLSALVGIQDYPASALQAGEQGTVGFRLTVGPDGQVTRCDISASSGSSVLDAATCRLMQSRARFTPAQDRLGRPTSDRVAARIDWKLPAEPAARR